MLVCLCRSRKCSTLGIVPADRRHAYRRQAQPLLYFRRKRAFCRAAFHNFRQNPVGNVEKLQQLPIPCAGFRGEHLSSAGDRAFRGNGSRQQIRKQIRHWQNRGTLVKAAAVPLTEQLKQRVDLHDLCACPAVEFRCRQELFCLLQNAVCSAVPIMPRQFQQGAVCPQHTVVHAPRINGDAFIGCNGIACLQALFQFFHELRQVPVQSAVLGNGFIGKAVHFLQGDAAAVKTCQHGTAGGRSEIQCQHIPHHGVSSGRTTPFFNRTLA